jgi:hypothetical protein
MRRTAAWLGLTLLGLFGPGTALADETGQGVSVDLGGLRSRTPAAWKAEKATGPFRVYQFRLPRVKGDERDASLVVFHLGTARSGSNRENIKRQQNLFIPPEGETIDKVTKVEEFKVGEVPVTYVDIHGTYKDKPGPMVPDEQAVKRPRYRMLYAIFESPNGPYYLRLVGPNETMEHVKPDFDKWLKAFK